jgi:serine protease AprX
MTNPYAIMNIDRTGRPRAHVHNLLGADFADKATDEFCRAFVLPSPPAILARDGFPGLMRVVLELIPQPARLDWIDDAIAKVQSRPAWQETFHQTRLTLEELVGEAAGLDVKSLISPAAILREACVREKRERYYHLAALVRSELDRAVSRSMDSGSVESGLLEPPVQFCWVNQTFLVSVDPRELAALAGDPLVSQIDVPRGVELQVRRTAETIGAVQHRERSMHTGRGVKIAVIDSEVAPLEDVFQNRIQHKKNFTDEIWSNPGKHGTTVAGIIAANGRDARGIAPEATIFNYKVVKTGSVGAPLDSHVALALEQALEDGAHIANCSWNTKAHPDGRSREARACDTVWACGMTVVVAMGNYGSTQGSVRCPADANGVIAVGATGINGKAVEEYSSRGPSQGTKPCPDVVAPGGNDNERIQCFLPDGGFGDCDSGTSFAVPHISGMLALLLEAKPGMTPNQQAELLKSLCRPLRFGTANDYGRGLPSLANLP